jgi:transcriptional regulator with XRE-family HTH domain
MKNEALLELRKRVESSSQKDVAAGLMFSPTYISEVLAGKREVSAPLAKALGYKRITQYVKLRK